MPFGGRSERYELNGTGQLQRDRTYGSIVRDRTYGSIGSYSNPDPEAHRNFINDDDLDFQVSLSSTTSRRTVCVSFLSSAANLTLDLLLLVLYTWHVFKYIWCSFLFLYIHCVHLSYMCSEDLLLISTENNAMLRVFSTVLPLRMLVHRGTLYVY